MAGTGSNRRGLHTTESAIRHICSQMLLQCHDKPLLLQVLRRSGTPKEQAYAKRLEKESADIFVFCGIVLNELPAIPALQMGRQADHLRQTQSCLSEAGRPAGSEAPPLAPGHTGAVQCGS